MKSEAMLLSLEWRFSRGRFLTPALLGYDRVEVPDGHGGRKMVLAVNEDEARTVRLMYYMLLSGSSPAELAATPDGAGPGDRACERCAAGPTRAGPLPR